MTNRFLTVFSLFLLFFFPKITTAQSDIQWATAIYNSDVWKYRRGNSEPPSDWNTLSFDDSLWESGQGGIGYGDGDDNTIIGATPSVYLRKTFNVVDTAAIRVLLLHADYDDGFVAYLNGKEIARNNLGDYGSPVPFNYFSDNPKEAQLYQGGLPELFLVSGNALHTVLRQGENILSIQVHNENPQSSDLSSNFFLSLGLTIHNPFYRPTPQWFVAPSFSTDLPLLHIQTFGQEIEPDTKITAQFSLINHENGQINHLFDPPNGYDGAVGIEIRGNSSLSFPKKNYALETRHPNGSNNNVELLGMPRENDWVLHGPYSDKSLLRNVLAYHLGTTTGRYAPRTRLCELLINADYRGVYILTEKIKRDDNRVDIAKLTPDELTGDDLTGGYLLQIDRDFGTTPIDGWYSSSLPIKYYIYHDPNGHELAPLQREYIKNYITHFESVMGSSDWATRYDDFIDEASWVDYLLATELGKHIDAFKLSFYMYKDKDSRNPKLQFGPLWDFNLAFGNFDFACPPDPTGWSYDWQNTCDFSHPFWVKRLTEIPQLQHQAKCRWKTLRLGAWHTDSLLDFMDENVLRLEEAQVRNFERWPTLGNYVWPNNYIGNSYEDEIDYLKNWLTQRLDWMDTNMPGDCGLFVAEKSAEKPKPLIFPNPTSGLLFLEMPVSAQVSVFNANGQKMRDFSLKKGENRLDLTDLPRGLYVLRMVGEDGFQAVSKVLLR